MSKKISGAEYPLSSSIGKSHDWMLLHNCPIGVRGRAVCMRCRLPCTCPHPVFRVTNPL